MDKKLTASDLFFNLVNEGTIIEAQAFLDMYPFFKDVFTAIELHEDYQKRI